MIKHVQLVTIFVNDQDKAVDFYVNKLGLEKRVDSDYAPGYRWIEVAPPGAQTSLTLVTWFEDMTPGSVQGLVLDTADIERTRGELSRKQVVLSEIKNAPWGRYCTFQDPDGNGFVLVQAGAR